MASAAELDAPVSTTDAFRLDVRDWLAANFPPALKGKDNAMSAIDGPTDERPRKDRKTPMPDPAESSANWSSIVHDVSPTPPVDWTNTWDQVPT